MRRALALATLAALVLLFAARDPAQAYTPGRQGVIYQVDWTVRPVGVATMPAWLSFTRASAATVQTGTSTVVTAGITTDVARIGRRLDADSVGLVIEPARTNSLKQAHDTSAAPWASTNTTVTGAIGLGPDASGSTARRGVTPSVGYHLTQGSLVVARMTASIWGRANSGTSQFQMRATDGGTTLGSHAVYRAALTTAWERVAVSMTQATVGGVYLDCPVGDWTSLGGGNCTSIDAWTDLAQLESGAYPTEAILTTTASATRAGERLYLASATSAVHIGRLSLAVSCRPKSTLANADGVQRLWTSGADYAELATTGVLTISIGGATNTTAAFTWAQYDSVDVWVAAGGSVASQVSYRVNGGAVVHPAIAGSALGNVSTAGALDLLNNGASPPLNQLAAWITGITLYKLGASPWWK